MLDVCVYVLFIKFSNFFYILFFFSQLKIWTGSDFARLLRRAGKRLGRGNCPRTQVLKGPGGL